VATPLGADLAVERWPGRIAATSIDQHLRGEPVTGPEQLAAIALRPVDDEERAAIFRQIEQAERIVTPTLAMDRRLRTFEELDQGLGDEQARREALRCLSCGCLKAAGCGLRRWATAYLADPYRFLGRRRRFERDTSHPEVVYEPGKCILCDACVRIAAEAGEELGLSIVGRASIASRSRSALPFPTSCATPTGAAQRRVPPALSPCAPRVPAISQDAAVARWSPPEESSESLAHHPVSAGAGGLPGRPPPLVIPAGSG
jgi:formate dehydrogenase major subunit